MKKIIYTVLFSFNSILLVLAVMYFLNGSLEEFPTQEQQEKIKVTMGGLSIIFLVIELILLSKIIKQRQKLFSVSK